MSEERKESIVIAITGGAGSGKSSVAHIIESRGYKMIYTDNLAKSIMQENKSVIKKIKNEFGDNAYLSDNTLNRSYMSSVVFSGKDDGTALEKLNRIVHPPVIDKMSELVESYEQQGEKLIFVESALIFEAGLEEGFDYILVVDADMDKRVERIMERTAESQESIMMRMQSQMPAEEKRNYADFVIENNGTEKELAESVEFLLKVFEELACVE